MNTANHWDRIYASSPPESLGWYEEHPTPSFGLISRCNLGENDPLIDVGSGATTLLRILLDHGYRNLIALDHSQEALRQLKQSLPEDQVRYVRFLLADICSDGWIEEAGEVALWHDRALLHFLTKKSDREQYLDRLRSLVRKDGYIVIGAFALNGAAQCSGLPVQRYSSEQLFELVGNDFRLEEAINYLYRMPGGDTRPYVYVRFRRTMRSGQSETANRGKGEIS